MNGLKMAVGETASLSERAFLKLDEHWAVTAIGADELKRCGEVVRRRLAPNSVGEQIEFSFEDSEEDNLLLERVTLAFELAAIEGLDELSRPLGENRQLRDQAVAASSRVFGIRCLLPIPKETLDRVFFVLHLSAVACCGDRRADLRCWYQERKDALEEPSVAGTEWENRLLYRLFGCWVGLFRGERRDDLDRVHEVIAGLREDQNLHEERYLQGGSGMASRATAFRLAAFYNWAKVTETLATYISQGKSEPFGELDKYFEAGIEAAAASGDPRYEMMLRWLRAAARIMVTGFSWTRTTNAQA